MKNLIVVSEETAKEIARQLFGFDAPCVQAELNCKKAWWEFDIGKIQLIIPNFYNERKDKYPYGELYLRGCFYYSDILDSCFGKVYFVNGKIVIISYTTGFADTGDTLARNIDYMLVPNEDIENLEYHLTDSVRRYLHKHLKNYEKEIRNIFKTPKGIG